MDKYIPEGGFTIARKIFDSGIWSKPPLYFKVWVWIIGSANHSDRTKGGYKYKRGELVTSYDEIIKANAHFYNRRHIFPTMKQIRIILEWLQKKGMIAAKPLKSELERTGADTTADTRAYIGLKIIVINYNTYQDIKNYWGRHHGRDLNEQGHNNNKLNKEKTSTVPQKKLKKPKSNKPGTSKKRKSEAKTQNRAAATKIYEFYIKEISPGSKDKRRAHVNIEKYLKSYDPNDLITAIKNYKTVSKNKDPEYRKDPANFFGTKKGNEFFMNYLPGEFKAVQNRSPLEHGW